MDAVLPHLRQGRRHPERLRRRHGRQSLEDDAQLKDGLATRTSRCWPSFRAPAHPPRLPSSPSIAALENQMKMMDSAASCPQLSALLKSLENGSGESDHLSNDCPRAVGDLRAGGAAARPCLSRPPPCRPCHPGTVTVALQVPGPWRPGGVPGDPAEDGEARQPAPAPRMEGRLDLTATHPAGQPSRRRPPSLLFLSRDRVSVQALCVLVCAKPLLAGAPWRSTSAATQRSGRLRVRPCRRGCSTLGNLKQHLLTHRLRELPPQLLDPNFALGPGQAPRAWALAPRPPPSNGSEWALQGRPAGRGSAASLPRTPGAPGPPTVMSPGLAPMLAPPTAPDPQAAQLPIVWKTFPRPAPCRSTSAPTSGEKPLAAPSRESSPPRATFKVRVPPGAPLPYGSG